MARKRMIKPEYWTDSTMVQLPVEARLLFIGMWNFADDFGYLDDEPERLALQILPADDIDVDLMVDLLVAAGRVERYLTPDGAWILYIPHFVQHQRVDHPAKAAYPDVATCIKVSIPLQVRREIAVKYGCKPGEQLVVSCYYCGAPGLIHWPRTRKGLPGAWVAFSNLELDHFVPEREGGATSEDNLVLACRHCNRAKHTEDALAFAINREDSRDFAQVPKSSPQVKLSQVKLSQVNTTDPSSIAREHSANDRRTIGGGDGSVLKIHDEGADAGTVTPRLRRIGLTGGQAGKVLAAQPRTLGVSVDAWGQWIACHQHGEDGIKNPVSYAYTGLLAGNLPELADDPAELAAEEKKRAGQLKQREVSRFAQAPPRPVPPPEPVVPREELTPQQVKAMMRAHNPLKAISNGQANPYQTPGPDDDR